MQSEIELIVEDVKDHDNAKIVRFVGDLDATNVNKVVDKVFDLINGGFLNIIADFEKLRYVNSTGLGILLDFSKTTKKKNGAFKIVNINENVFEIIEIIGATTLLDIYDDIDEAIESL